MQVLDSPFKCPRSEETRLVAGRAAVEGMECAGQDYREREAMGGSGGSRGPALPLRDGSAVAFVEKGEQGQHADGGAENTKNPDDNEGALQHG